MADEGVPTVLVTGASGFIASHCIKQLQESGEYKVRGTVRSLKNEERCQAIKNLVQEPRYPIELFEANLLDEAGWKEAAQGCTYVLHIASPFYSAPPKHEDEIIRPAVDGTLNVLKASVEVGGVKRVVVTSSMAAVYGGNTGELDESCWSDPKVGSAYEKSKTLAEKAAWEYVNGLPEDKKIELAVMQPGFVIGPVLIGTCESVVLINKLLSRQMSMVPEITMPLVDVRSVAKGHIIAMTLPEAAGNRHILCDIVGSFIPLAHALAAELNPQGYNVPTKKAPKYLVWVMSWLKKDIRAIYPYIGMKMIVNNSRMREVLKLEPSDPSLTVVEMAHTMIERGLATRLPGYKGRSSKPPADEAVASKSEDHIPADNSSSAKENDAETPAETPGKDEPKAEGQDAATKPDDDAGTSANLELNNAEAPALVSSDTEKVATKDEPSDDSKVEDQDDATKPDDESAKLEGNHAKIPAPANSDGGEDASKVEPAEDPKVDNEAAAAKPDDESAKLEADDSVTSPSAEDDAKVNASIDEPSDDLKVDDEAAAPKPDDGSAKLEADDSVTSASAESNGKEDDSKDEPSEDLKEDNQGLPESASSDGVVVASDKAEAPSSEEITTNDGSSQPTDSESAKDETPTDMKE